MLTVLIEISHQWPYILVLIVFSPYWLRPQIQVVNIEGAIGTTTPDSELCQVNFVEGGSRFENERRRHRDVMIHIFPKKHNYTTTHPFALENVGFRVVVHGTGESARQFCIVVALGQLGPHTWTCKKTARF